MITIDQPSVTDVHAVIEEVWTSFLSVDEPILPGAPTLRPEDGWTAAITVTGAWEAMILVSLPDELAGVVTASMLGLDETEQTSTEDLTDALGELVNIIGGGVKSLMAGPSVLSLPLVAQGAVTTSSSLEEVCVVDLSWHAHPVRVSIATPRPAGG